MQILLTIIAFLVIFSALILIHECGHFFMARRHGIKVEEFGFGLPPRAFGKKIGEVLYSFNWIPFGGFVRMLGEDSHDKKARKNKRSFCSKTPWQRTQVVCAGVVMNFLLAWGLFSIGFTVGMEPLIMSMDDFNNEIRRGNVVLQDVESLEGVEQGLDLPRVVVTQAGSGFEVGDEVLRFEESLLLGANEWPLVEGDFQVMRGGEEVEVFADALGESSVYAFIDEVAAGSPAELGGLLAGDVVVGVNGQAVESAEEMVAMVKGSDEAEVTYEVERDGVLKSITMTLDENRRVGVLLGNMRYFGESDLEFKDAYQAVEIVEIKDVSYPWYEAPWQSLIEMKRIGGVTLVTIADVFGSVVTKAEVPQEVSGPVGIAQMTGVYVQEGAVPLMRFMALLSLSLAVINLFPFPGLDGGRQLFIIIEVLRGGKPVDAKFEAYVHTFGFFFLIAVILLVTLQDVARLV